MNKLKLSLTIAVVALCALAVPTSADTWENYELGRYYRISETTEPVVSRSAEAVVYFRGATGFIISPDGYILTNHHVYTSFGERGVVYRKWIGQTYAQKLRIKLVLKSRKYDVALYKAEGATDLPYLPLRLDPKVGEDVFVLGHPKSWSLRATFGKILAKDLVIGGRPSIEYSAQTWWGSSGSPVLDRQGRVVAIHWGWDSKGISNGRLTGVPFELIVKAVPKIGEVAGKKKPESPKLQPVGGFSR